LLHPPPHPDCLLLQVPEALIGLAMLSVSGLYPPLPGRTHPPTDEAEEPEGGAMIDRAVGEAHEWRATFGPTPTGFACRRQ
jgi:hypothetical protein